MLPQLQRNFDTLQTQKQAWLTRLSAMDEARLFYKPQGSAWTALGVLDHLVKTESEILQEAISKLPEHRIVSMRDRVQGRLMEGLFRTPSRVKVPPEVVSVRPAENLDLTEISSRWTAVRKATADWLGTISPDDLRYGCFRHPVSGWMALPQTLRFWSSHLVHHQYQLKRQDESYGKEQVGSLTSR